MYLTGTSACQACSVRAVSVRRTPCWKPLIYRRQRDVPAVQMFVKRLPGKAIEPILEPSRTADTTGNPSLATVQRGRQCFKSIFSSFMKAKRASPLLAREISWTSKQAKQIIVHQPNRQLERRLERRSFPPTPLPRNVDIPCTLTPANRDPCTCVPSPARLHTTLLPSYRGGCKPAVSCPTLPGPDRRGR